MKDPVQGVSNFQLDVLKEIGNIGAGNAATALSNLLNRKIEMNIPTARVISLNEVSELVGGPDLPVASVFLEISGDIGGSMYFILPIKKATSFAMQLTGEKDFSFANPEYPEMAQSAFQELGNILAGSYVTALSDLTKLQIIPSVPAVAFDMFGALISYGLLKISNASDYTIIIDTEFVDPTTSDEKEIVKGHLLLLPDLESYKKIFTSLGV